MAARPAAPLPRLVPAAALFAVAAALPLSIGVPLTAAALLVVASEEGWALAPFLLAGHFAGDLVRAPDLAELERRSRVVATAVAPTRPTATGRHATSADFESSRGLVLERGSAAHHEHGDVFECDGWLRPAGPPHNPGARPSGALLRADRTVPRPDLAASGPWSAWIALRRAIDRLADAIEQRLRERLPERAAALTIGLVLGRTEALDASFRDSFRAIGAWHFVAVSGSHIVICAAFLRALLGRLLAHERAREVVVALAVAGYALLSGGEAPALRAVIGFAGVALFSGRHRPASASSWLAAAFLAIAALDPPSIGEAGLQLSFVAVVALAAASRFGPRRSPKGTGTGVRPLVPLLKALRLAIAAATATAPLTALHFASFSWVAPIAALVLGPIVSFALIGGLVAAATTALPAGATALLGPPLEFAAWLLQSLARLGDRLPATPWPVAPPTPLVVVLLASSWLALLARRPAVAIALIVAAGVAVRLGDSRRDALVVLDVGHGQAALLRHGGRCDLVDCGSDGTVSGRDVATSLRALDVVRLDALFVSHLDSDHVGLVTELAATLPVATVVLSSAARPEFEDRGAEPSIVALRNALARDGVAVSFLSRGDRLGSCRALWPPADRRFGARNDGGLVLLADVGGATVLLPGDLERYPLTEFAAALDERIDVLLLPHHGNADRAVEALLERATGARLALASRVEPEPPEATRQQLRRAGIPWLSTGGGGAVECEVAPGDALLPAAIERGGACR
jgi:competence protein ComEC